MDIMLKQKYERFSSQRISPLVQNFNNQCSGELALFFSSLSSVPQLRQKITYVFNKGAGLYVLLKYLINLHLTVFIPHNLLQIYSSGTRVGDVCKDNNGSYQLHPSPRPHFFLSQKASNVYFPQMQELTARWRNSCQAHLHGLLGLLFF